MEEPHSLKSVGMTEQLDAIHSSCLSGKARKKALWMALHRSCDIGSCSSVDDEVEDRLGYVQPHLQAIVEGRPPSGAQKKKRSLALHLACDGSRLDGHQPPVEHVSIEPNDSLTVVCFGAPEEALQHFASRLAALEVGFTRPIVADAHGDVPCTRKFKHSCDAGELDVAGASIEACSATTRPSFTYSCEAGELEVAGKGLESCSATLQSLTHGYEAGELDVAGMNLEGYSTTLLFLLMGTKQAC